MRENTPPHSPFSPKTDDETDDYVNPEEDDDLVYVGDDIDEVIEHLEGFPADEDGEKFVKTFDG